MTKAEDQVMEREIHAFLGAMRERYGIEAIDRTQGLALWMVSVHERELAKQRREKARNQRPEGVM